MMHFAVFAAILQLGVSRRENTNTSGDGLVLLQLNSQVNAHGHGRTDFPVLYGIESCPGQSYVDMVDAQLDTWAKAVPRENLIIVGGPRDDVAAGVETATGFTCGDDKQDLACKEGLLLWRAVDRAERLGSKWLIVSQDDKYIWRGALEEELLAIDAEEPQVIASFGCGQPWRYNPGSKNGTKPFPLGWVEPMPSCQGVEEKGGICGGPTYFVSRGALRLLRTRGQTPDAFKHAFLAPMADAPSRGVQSDTFASCFYYGRGIKQGLISKLIERTYRANELDELTPGSLESSPLAVHVDVPKDLGATTIRRFHREWNMY
jgi:hypothetical protein